MVLGFLCECTVCFIYFIISCIWHIPLSPPLPLAHLPPHPLPLAITVLLHELSLELCTFEIYMLLFFFLVFRKQEGFLVLKITVNP